MSSKKFFTFVLASLSTPLLVATAWGLAIYGEDDRLELRDYRSTLLSPQIEAAIRSTAILIHSGSLEESATVTKVKAPKTFKEHRNLCEGERFSDQNVVGFCSGTLVAPDVVLTAGHCVKGTYPCSELRFLFDYSTQDANDRGATEWESAEIYRCKKVMVARTNGLYTPEGVIGPSGLDYAFIKLDRPVTGRSPIEMNLEGGRKKGDPLIMIGHPSGLPAKATPGSFGAYLPRVNFFRGDTVFSTDMDAFGGNSGSAVLSASTGKIEGVLVRGSGADFALSNPNDPKSCKRAARHEQSFGAEVSRVDAIKREIKRLLPELTR